MDFFASGFAAVDGAGDTGSFVSYLDLIHSIPFFRECKRESYRRLAIRPGARVLEIGCGNGVDAANMAELAGPDGRVVGIDVSSTMLASARAREYPAGTDPGFLLCDAGYLAFPDATFDAVRTDRVLQHTHDPAAVIREMARVTRDGGRLVSFEPDWETFAIYPGNRDVTRKILNFWCDHIPNGWVGRNVSPAFHAAGLIDIETLPVTLVVNSLPLAKRIFDLDTTTALAKKAGIIRSEEAEDWMEGHAAAEKAGRFFSSLTFFLVSGTKPGGNRP